MDANTLVLALSLIPPGHLRRALEEGDPSDLAVLARIIRRAQLVGEIQFDARPEQQLLRRMREGK
jgi:hypothetical protein